MVKGGYKHKAVELCYKDLIIFHITARKWAGIFRECSSTINQNAGVNKTSHTDIYHYTQPRTGRQRCKPSGMKCMYMLNKLHLIFDFRNNVKCVRTGLTSRGNTNPDLTVYIIFQSRLSVFKIQT